MATRTTTAGQAGTATTAPRLGLALVVIATAQLMIVLDATIVNVALPRIQAALGFSGSGLEWVINGYALALGGLLLIGGRAGDLLGRRRMFVTGLLLFSAASLAGGFATSPAWLLTARAVQGAGGAIVAPTALALIATTFPEGPPRSRAMGVYAAMSVAGAALGLLAGGLLVAYASWRWVLFVNVPVGVAVALAALAVLPAAGRRPGRLDLPGAVTGTGGVAAVVYGLSNAATGADGTSHWGDPAVLAALAGGVALLAAFVVIEARSPHALLPVRLLRDRNRAGAYLVMLGTGTAVFGVFFFLTVFVQEVWGYSALRAGVAFLPLTVAMLAASSAAAALMPRIGARPLLMAGSAASAGGLYWLSLMTEHGSYAGSLLGPVLLAGAGVGLLVVPLPQVALAGVAEADSGVAASLLNAGRQVGGALGLAVLGTVGWTVVAHSARAHAASHAAVQAAPGAAARVQALAYQHALAAGFDRAFLVAAAITVLMLLAAAVMIRPPRAELAAH
jgi:EmrB/QacA subfamily drug resistance transporter